jgi:hypothetical protein
MSVTTNRTSPAAVSFETHPDRYDVIRLDPPELHTAGIVNLYTLEFFELARDHLEPGGIFSIWGALIAGVFNQLLPFLFQAQWGVNPNFLLIVFGAGLLQVLLSAPGGLIDQFPKDMANLGRLIARKVPVTRQALLGIGSILALILGIVFIVTVSPLLGIVVVILSPVLSVLSQD